MNYNPYYFTPYASSIPTRTGLFSGLFKGASGIKWSSILGGTQKVLNIANQAIPMIKQVSPVMKNAKTMFRVMNEFKKVDTPNVNNNVNNDVNTNIKQNINSNVEQKINVDSQAGPTFFI